MKAAWRTWTILALALASGLALCREPGAFLVEIGPAAATWIVLVLAGRRMPAKFGDAISWLAPLVAIGAGMFASADPRGFLRLLIPTGIAAAGWAAIVHAPGLWRRRREVLLALASAAIGCGALALLAPRIFEGAIRRQYALDVDHRPRPNTAETNEDGLREADPPSAFREGADHILFLGDSFTWGLGVGREETFVAEVGRRLRALRPGAARSIRTVNFGWVSSSPVLQARQLLQIGAKYRPRLVVQCLDMSDFHDDLTYVELLRAAGQERPLEITAGRALRAMLSTALGVRDYGAWLAAHTRLPLPTEDAARPGRPDRRFFFAWQPLDRSRPYLTTTWDAIRRTRDAAAALGAKYVLLIIPRYPQYDRRAAPRDPERAEWPQEDEFLFAIFVYFREQAAAAPFPVRSLLDEFQRTGSFPSSPPDDAHWDAAGHRVAAEAITRVLLDEKSLGLP